MVENFKNVKSNNKVGDGRKNKCFITRTELKSRYNIGNDKVTILMHLPKFPVLKIGNRYLIDLDKLEKLEEEAIIRNKSLEEVLIL